MTGNDFVSLCDANEITVKITSKVSRGLYYFAGGHHYIAISSRLSPSQRSFVGWHEFAHFLQNFERSEPVAAFSDVQPDRASERLADIFAIIALRPDHICITDPLDFLKMLMTRED